MVRHMTLRYCAGDWDIGSPTLEEELAEVSPGYIGQRIHIDKVFVTDGTDYYLDSIFVYEWTGERWKDQGMFEEVL